MQNLYLTIKEIIMHVGKLRLLMKEFHRLNHSYTLEKAFALKTIQNEIREMLKEERNWSDFKNSVYMKIFPQIPQEV